MNKTHIMKTIKVGGHTYKVVIKEMKSDALAECDYNTTTITIDKNIKSQTVRESAFIHELIHSCNSTFGSENMEHALLDSLAEQMYQILKDNKLLNQESLDKLLK